MMTMLKSVAPVHNLEDIKPKASKIGDMVMHAAIKSGLSPEELQNICERGDDLQRLMQPIFKRLSYDLSLVDSDLLEPIDIVSVTGTEAFGTREKFQIGTPEGVKIYYLGDNFKKHFLNANGTGKNELDVPDQNLRVHRLRKNSVDSPILKELGGEEVVETNLAIMFELMKKQGQGQAGVLLVDGKANIFYIRDDAGTVWAVSCRWRAGGGWRVGASAISGPLGWYAGLRVFSR
jgi:hypothetical protein